MTGQTTERELGHQLRALRLKRELRQSELAQRAGIALNAVKNLESGNGATIGSLVSVLEVLGRAEWLKTLLPPVALSPREMLRARAPRQRVSRRRLEPPAA
jgi:transcriptional regulator with XRE-family HTH domain